MKEKNEKFNTCPDCRKLIAEGKCKADCCGIVPFEDRIFQQIKKNAYEKDYEQKVIKNKGQKFVIPISKDFKCIFLNREDCSCVIYNSPRKPDLCRQFGMSETEVLLACMHINPDKKNLIEGEANETLEQIQKVYDRMGGDNGKINR